MPDLDIDFADTGREQVIEYVRNKYGHANCAQIITFGSMQARLVIRDVARVMGFTPGESDRIAKLIPFGSNIYAALQTDPGAEEPWQVRRARRESCSRPRRSSRG